MRKERYEQRRASAKRLNDCVSDEVDEQRMTAGMWWALAFACVGVLALVVVYCDLYIWRP